MTIENKFETILCEVADHIMTVKVNRPDKLNALNRQVLTDLKNLLLSLTKDAFSQSIYGLILTGEGDKAFIAGADIAGMREMTPAQAKDFGRLGQEVTLLFENLPIPCIAAVNGFALGGGCEMAMSCDLILAQANAVFGQPEVKLGIIPGFGGTQRLAKLVGLARAREWTFSGRNIKAQEAKEAGLVLEICDSKEALLARARELLKSFYANSPLAVARCKLSINHGVDLPTAQGLQVELDQFATIFSSHDAKEGISAFVEKRKPQFNAQ